MSDDEIVIRVPINVNEYPEQLRARLEEYGIAHGELARESGISPTQLSRMFNGPMVPTLQNVARLEAAVVRIRARMRREAANERRRKH